MKLAFIKKLTELASTDPRIMLLTGDLGFQIFDEFRDRFKARYVNVGVAEAQMASAAAGMALAGKKPVTYSIASFMTSRCFEQIKLSIAYHNAPVVIIGAGGGFAYGHSGVTHHAPDDISLMRSIPGMTVVAPGDAGEVEDLLPQLLELDGPSYMRIGRGREPVYVAKEPAVLGRCRKLRDGKDIAVITTGDIASEAISAIKALNARNIFPAAYQFHTVKPLDTGALETIAEKFKHIIVAEENIPQGGLGCAIREWEARRKIGTDITYLCGPDEFVLGSPHQHEIRSKYGFDSSAVAEEALKIEKHKNSGMRAL